MFVRNLWYVAAWASELTEGLLARTIIGDPVLLYRESSGKDVAIGNLCPHRFAPLDKGRRCEDDTIECTYHGLRFDSTGACTLNPHEEGRIPHNARVPAYPLCERDGILWVWMGEAARADENLIPSFDQVTSRKHRTITGHMMIKANYELVSDNLLDQSHAQFLHKAFFRADLLQAAHDIRQSGNTVESRRWQPAIKAPYVYSRILPDPEMIVDMWMGVRWDPPGLHRLDVGVTPAGRPREEGIGREGSHILTPETESTTHYFFASSRNYKLNDEAEDKAIMKAFFKS